MYAGVEYYVNPAGTAAAILTPLVGQGRMNLVLKVIQ